MRQQLLEEALREVLREAKTGQNDALGQTMTRAYSHMLSQLAKIERLAREALDGGA